MKNFRFLKNLFFWTSLLDNWSNLSKHFVWNICREVIRKQNCIFKIIRKKKLRSEVKFFEVSPLLANEGIFDVFIWSPPYILIKKVLLSSYTVKTQHCSAFAYSLSNQGNAAIFWDCKCKIFFFATIIR